MSGLGGFRVRAWGFSGLGFRDLGFRAAGFRVYWGFRKSLYF